MSNSNSNGNNAKTEVEVYRKGISADKADIVDFANYIFSQSETSRPHDFKKLLPKIYDDKYDTTDWHYLCEIDGKIKAMVMLEKCELRVGKHTLTVGGVGTVSVHPYSRGGGYMKKLMNSVSDDIRSQCDLGALGGQRQRYEYFGYEPSGVQLNFHVENRNIHHRYRDVAIDNISFLQLTQADTELIGFVRKLHDTHPLSGVRGGSSELFFDVMSSWKNRLWIVSDSGKSVGYILGSPSGVTEMMLTDYSPTLLQSVIKAFMQKNSSEHCSFTVSMAERELIKEFTLLCEGISISNNHCFLLSNPQKVITAFLELKATYSPLQNGSIIIKIGDKTLNITLDNGTVTVEDTDLTPILCFSEIDALRQLCSPMSGIDGGLDSLPEFARGWFPLPIFLPSTDAS